MAPSRSSQGAKPPAGGWMISSDSHIVEPPDLWTARVPRALAERAPRVVSQDDGDWWYVDGRKTMSFVGIQAGARFAKDPDKLVTSARFEDVRAAAYDPQRYLAENEEDGVWGSVLYPSEGLVIFSVPNTEVVSASMCAYNDWIADFCAQDPSRLKGIAMVNVDEIDAAIAELERVRRAGLAGVLITVKPPAWAPFHSDVYEPFWAAAQDLGLPISLHVATDRGDPRGGDAAFQLDVKRVPPSVFINKDHQVRQALADLILEGVFERFPRLRVGSVEHELGWIPFFLEQMDYTYTDRPARGNWYRFKERGVLPSEFWRRNCFASFQEDATGVRLRDLIGVDAITWGSDYPHTESTFPRSQQIAADFLADVPAEEARAIVAGNAARLYGFELPDAS
jgi:predicted TIM-barrel fold metal-dependent hydrolase